MKIVHTDGSSEDFYGLCEKLDASLNENVPSRKAAGLNSLYNVEKINDVFLLYDDEKAIGSIGLWLHDNETCELMRVFIDNEYRGRGLAGKLVAEIESLAKSKGYNKIALRTWSSTPYSIRAYEKLGYTLIPASKYKYTDKFPKALPLANLRVYMEKEI